MRTPIIGQAIEAPSVPHAAARTSAAAEERRPARGISPQARQHIALRRQVIRDCPGVRSLVGPDPRGALAALLILAIHWTAVWLVSQTNVLIVFVVAFFVGQVTIHSAAALIHETAHRLVFRERRAKLAFDLLLEVITTSFARQLTYQHEHVSSHHPHLGNYERDYEHEDVCRFLARRAYRARHPGHQHLLTVAELLVNLLPFGFLFANRIFSPIYQRGTGRAVKDRARNIGATQASVSEQRLFIATSLAVNLFLFLCFGFLGWLYQVWSLSLFLGKFGITNLGQSLAEHPGDDLHQPTRSTYWWGNLILFNTGYHHEHHTFPDIAWSRLPRLKALAPEAFRSTGGRSYVRCWWDHVKDDFGPSRRNPLQTENLSGRCALQEVVAATGR
jgi:sphingolipid 4-desaturase/C4-monooxygenase